MSVQAEDFHVAVTTAKVMLIPSVTHLLTTVNVAAAVDTKRIQIEIEVVTSLQWSRQRETGKGNGSTQLHARGMGAAGREAGGSPVGGDRKVHSTSTCVVLCDPPHSPVRLACLRAADPEPEVE